jgi:PAS domain-containing protein
MSETDVIRRWTRLLSGLRTRSAKLRRPDSPAGAPLDDLLGEALEACDGLLQDLAGAELLADRLRRELHGEIVNRQYLLEQMPMACVATDEASLIQNANQPAAELFNISPKHLRGRLFLHFSADRAAFGQLLQNLPLDGGRVEASVPVRPRERGPFTLHALIVPETSADRTSWLWFLKPELAFSGALSLDQSVSLAGRVAEPRARSRSIEDPPTTGS